jgi:Protein of unknown function (DUF4199)
MKNAIKYGILIGVISGLWILMMHFAGIYVRGYSKTSNISWLEWTSIIIPFIGLYLGIKNFRDYINIGKMEFFEGLFEGFKIILVGGVISAFFAVLYLQYSSTGLTADYMGRIGGAGLVGILLNICISLALMNRQKNL